MRVVEVAAARQKAQSEIKSLQEIEVDSAEAAIRQSESPDTLATWRPTLILDSRDEDHDESQQELRRHV